MGGGALMTPILVLLFKVQPLAAVSSDLVAAMVMKPVGGGVHLLRRTVNRQLVVWLMIGSVPSTFLSVLVLRLLGNSAPVQTRLKLILTASYLVGSIPGVYMADRLSSRARDALIRPALVFVLLASGLKLVSLGTPELAAVMVSFVLVARPIWGTIDARSRPAHHWE